MADRLQHNSDCRPHITKTLSYRTLVDCTPGPGVTMLSDVRLASGNFGDLFRGCGVQTSHVTQKVPDRLGAARTSPKISAKSRVGHTKTKPVSTVACLDSQCHRVPTVGLLPMLDQAAEYGCGWGMSHKDMLKQAHAVHGSGCDESGWGETGR